MSKSTDVSSNIGEIDAELELSAADLIALADDKQTGPREPRAALEPPRPPKSSSHKKLVMPLTLITAVGVIGATYVFTSPASSPEPLATTWQPTAQTAQSEEPPPEQLAEGEPVRFANPFDANEVFEFPPGTPEAQARDAVAEVLLKRAMSRQRT